MKQYLIVFLLISFGCAALGAVEIPLQQGSSVQAGGAEGFAVIDMAKVMDNFPETQKKEKELKLKIDDIRNQTNEKQQEIDKLRKEIQDAEEKTDVNEKSLQPSLDGFIVLGSTGSADASDMPQDEKDGVKVKESTSTAKTVDEAEMKKKRQELDEKIKILEAFRAESDKRIEEMKMSFGQEVMGKIYNVLEELANEESVQIIVDKNNVLYGRADIDLTKKLIDRLSGRR